MFSAQCTVLADIKPVFVFILFSVLPYGEIKLCNYTRSCTIINLGSQMPRCNVKVFIRISLCLIYFYRSVQYNVLTYLSTFMHTGLCIPVGFSCIHMIVFYNQFCSYISLALAGPLGLEHLHRRLVWQVTATCRLFSVSTSDLDLLAWYEVRARPTESRVSLLFDIRHRLLLCMSLVAST